MQESSRVNQISKIVSWSKQEPSSHPSQTSGERAGVLWDLVRALKILYYLVLMRKRETAERTSSGRKRRSSRGERLAPGGLEVQASRGKRGKDSDRAVRGSASAVVGETHIRTRTADRSTPARRLGSRRQTVESTGENAEGLEPAHHLAWNGVEFGKPGPRKVKYGCHCIIHF